MSNENNKYTVILFPEFITLKAEVEKLRTEISMLLLERDELRLVVCKNIETAYMLAVGSIEYKAYELHCKVLRLKRKIDLNVIFSRLMDAGKLLFGRITHKEMKGKWLKINIKIFLHE